MRQHLKCLRDVGGNVLRLPCCSVEEDRHGFHWVSAVLQEAVYFACVLFSGDVGVNVDAVFGAASFPASAVDGVLAVVGQDFFESLAQRGVHDDEVNVAAHVAADSHLGGPPPMRMDGSRS